MISYLTSLKTTTLPGRALKFTWGQIGSAELGNKITAKQLEHKISSEKGQLSVCHRAKTQAVPFSRGENRTQVISGLSEKDQILPVPSSTALCPIYLLLSLLTSRSQGQVHMICPHLDYPNRLSISVPPSCCPSWNPN